ncbi:hypothetical protein EZS27_031747, partial [termite gut metagenome]
MAKYKQLVSALLFTFLSETMIVAQNNTNSPYTRYGYGQLSDQSSGKSKAMGGVAYGLRDNYQINVSNPASYTMIDSLTFMFEGGLTLQNANFSDGTRKLNAKNSSFDQLAMQFRLRKGLGMTLGLLPYSNVGYNLLQMETENSLSAISYSGEGGMHQIFTGFGWEVRKNLSIGANISYLWGDITRATSEYLYAGSAYSYEEITTLSAKTVKMDLGLQYTHRFGKKHALTAGAVFSPKRTLDSKASIITTVSTSTVKDTVADFGIPS